MPEPHTTLEDFYDEIEPLEEASAYRDAARTLLPLIDRAVGHCLAAATPEIGRAQIKFALGIEGRSMRAVAKLLDVTPAAISRGAKEFQEANNLPLPACMKSEEASEIYRESRIRQLSPAGSVENGGAEP